jgi:acetyl-CoA C-acetyltransferase
MDIVIAAGVESMTRVPMGLPRGAAAKAGFGTYMSPNMEARYPGIKFSQFDGAEMIAKKYGLRQGRARRLRLSRATASGRSPTKAGAFDKEIVPVEITDATAQGDMHTVDEGIRFDASLEA